MDVVMASALTRAQAGGTRLAARGPGCGLSFGLIHCRPRPFAGDREPAVRTGQERWRTVVNGGAQYSKACEG